VHNGGIAEPAREDLPLEQAEVKCIADHLPGPERPDLRTADPGGESPPGIIQEATEGDTREDIE
jgi:hypothetical protein